MRYFGKWILSRRAQHRMSESFAVGALLSAVGGFLDAYSYLMRGEVFANAQTGNFVLLGIHLAKGDFHKALAYIFPILAFALGVFLAELFRRRLFAWRGFHWRQIILAVETLFLLLVAFLPQEMNMLAAVFISFICALQVESFRKIHGNPFTTTMCTGNLRSGTELLFNAVKAKKDKDFQNGLEYYGVIVFFVAGAVLGVLFSVLWHEKAVLIACAFLSLTIFLIFIRIESEGNSDIQPPR
jgi:uncharacterized membrane protein YoaK (UPF0700 family)